MDLSPSFQYSRAALMKLKESSQSPNKVNESEERFGDQEDTL